MQKATKWDVGVKESKKRARAWSTTPASYLNPLRNSIKCKNFHANIYRLRIKLARDWKTNYYSNCTREFCPEFRDSCKKNWNFTSLSHGGLEFFWVNCPFLLRHQIPFFQKVSPFYADLCLCSSWLSLDSLTFFADPGVLATICLMLQLFDKGAVASLMKEIFLLSSSNFQGF